MAREVSKIARCVKIVVIVMSDPSSPVPPAITLASLRKGKYRPCSRNPVLAQCLSYFHRIEERGSGFRRMREQMLNHGLDQPLIGTDTGYFQITFPGPGDDIDRIRVPKNGDKSHYGKERGFSH